MTQMEDGAGTNPGNDSCLILAIRVIRGCTLLSNAAAWRGFSLGRDLLQVFAFDAVDHGDSTLVALFGQFG